MISSCQTSGLPVLKTCHSTGTQEFVIIHYADNVSYTCHGFINKNLDSVNDVHINLLRSSSVRLFIIQFKYNFGWIAHFDLLKLLF